MNPDFCSKPIISKHTLRSRRIALRKKRCGIPAQLDVTEQSELKQAPSGGALDLFVIPEPIEAVFHLYHAILRNVSGISNGWPIRIHSDLVGVTASLPAN